MRPRALALTIAAGAASAVALALVRLKRPRAGAARPAARPAETYRCACGEEFRVSGSGRHRVFWRAGAADDDPLLAARCPSCERVLV